jgi:hypothetical protein
MKVIAIREDRKLHRRNDSSTKFSDATFCTEHTYLADSHKDKSFLYKYIKIVNYFVIHLRHELHIIGLIKLISRNKRKILCFYIIGLINMNKNMIKITGLINVHEICKINKRHMKKAEKIILRRSVARANIVQLLSHSCQRNLKA